MNSRLEQLQQTEATLREHIKEFEQQHTDHVLATGIPDESIEKAIYSLRLSLRNTCMKIEEEKRAQREQYLLFCMGYSFLQEKMASYGLTAEEAHKLCSKIYEDFQEYSKENPSISDYEDENLEAYIKEYLDEIEEKYLSYYEKFGLRL